MAEWVVAGDIGRRLAELRSLLGETQSQFAKRFGRTWKRVSAWEHGDAVPPQSALEHAAESAGWDTAIFAEGGPYPKQALERPRSPAGARSPRSPGRRATDYAPPGADAETVGRVLRQMQDYVEGGRPASADQLVFWVREIVRATGGGTAPPPPQSPEGPSDGAGSPEADPPP